MPWHKVPHGVSRNKMLRVDRQLRLRARYSAGKMSLERYTKCIHLLYPMEGLWPERKEHPRVDLRDLPRR